jgi:hypothetical protein
MRFSVPRAVKELAPRLQSALQRFAKPWYRLRAVRIFRDKTSLSVTSALWPTIEAALRRSEVFIFMASPEAGQSEGTTKELTTFPVWPAPNEF